MNFPGNRAMNINEELSKYKNGTKSTACQYMYMYDMSRDTSQAVVPAHLQHQQQVAVVPSSPGGDVCTETETSEAFQALDDGSGGHGFVATRQAVKKQSTTHTMEEGGVTMVHGQSEVQVFKQCAAVFQTDTRYNQALQGGQQLALPSSDQPSQAGQPSSIPPGRRPPPHVPTGQQAIQTATPVGQYPPRPAVPVGQYPPRPAVPVGQYPPRPVVPVGQYPPRPAVPVGQYPPRPAVPVGQYPPQSIPPVVQQQPSQALVPISSQHIAAVPSQTALQQQGTHSVQAQEMSKKKFSAEFVDDAERGTVMRLTYTEAQRQQIHMAMANEIDGVMTHTHEIWIREIYTTTFVEICLGVGAYEETAVEKGVDCCCQTCLCTNLCNPREKAGVSRKLELTENLRLARNKGTAVALGIMKEVYTKAPIGSTIKEINVYFQFVYAVVYWILAIISLSEDGWSTVGNAFELSEFVFSSIQLIYLTFDTLFHCIYYTCRCKTCRKWKSYCKEKAGKQPDNVSQDADCDNCCQDYCTCCGNEKCRIACDVARIFVSELLFYPILLLSLFQFAEEYAEGNGVSATTWAKTIASLLYDLGPIYLSRMFILAGSIWSIQKVRNAVSEETKDEEGGGTEVHIDNTFHWKGACFQVMFVAQAYGQMLIQIMMIVTIVAKYYYEFLEHSAMYADMENISNQTSNTTSEMYANMENISNQTSNTTMERSYLPSPQLYYMMVVAYITPVLGILMFLMIHHFWTQNFPIKLILDMLALLKSAEWTDAKNVVNLNKTGKEYAETLGRIMFYASDDNFVKDYEGFRKTPLERKLVYPFASPLHVILALLYGGILLGFGICTLVGPEEARNEDWTKFYVVETLVILFVNFYALMVAMVWTVIIAGVIVLIIMVIFLACLAIGCSSSGSQTRRQY